MSVVLFVVSLVVGSAALGAALHLAGNAVALPSSIVGVSALLAAAMSVGIIPPLPQSHWRIPRSWSMLGYEPYVVIFGIVLGLGMLTALPSFGFYVLVAWGLTASLYACLGAFLVFAVARGAPSVVAATFWRGDDVTERVSRFRRRMRSLRILEPVLLGAAAGVLLQ